jgi:hypothetical protein
MAKNKIIPPLSILVIFLFINVLSNAQQQIPNPGFEQWEEIRADVFEPLSWNSIKNTDGGRATNRMAPEVIFRDRESHSGNNAIKMINESTMGIVANGLLTNGAIHGSIDKDKSFVYSDTTKNGYFTRFTGRPDSITGWYRYKPAENDSAMVVILLHDGYVSLPDHGTKSNWVGGVKLMLGTTPGESWVRFSFPFFYVKPSAPKYMLIVLSAGNRKKAVEGSVAYFDDLQLIY